MPNPGEHKTVQARILSYAREIDWTLTTACPEERIEGRLVLAKNPEWYVSLPVSLPGGQSARHRQAGLWRHLAV
jgi:hypothetical protein